MGRIEHAQNEMDWIDTRKSTCQRFFANQTLSFYFATLSCISFIMQTKSVRGDTDTLFALNILASENAASSDVCIFYTFRATHLLPKRKKMFVF